MKSILKQVAASLITGVIFLAFSLALSLGLLWVYTQQLEETPIELEERTLLVLDLGMTLTDAPAPPDFGSALNDFLGGESGPGNLHLLALTDAIRAAAEEPKISALYLEGSLALGENDVGYAGLEELREALQVFRDSGKPIIAYAIAPALADLFVLSKASDLRLDPFGVVPFTGLGLEVTFFGDFFEKYGVGIQVARAGSYKSAGESFVRNDLSPENREQLKDLLDTAWNVILADIGRDRAIAPEDLQNAADTKAILSPEQARDLDLVDRVSYKDEVLARLNEVVASDDDGDLRQMTVSRYHAYLRQQNDADNDGDSDTPRIYVMYLQGPIGFADAGVEGIDGEQVARRLRDLREDETVAAVVLRVNSPGGGVTASEAIQREVRRLEQVKTVVVSMGNVAASGGYWISTHADHIFAEATTITGSIGVFALIPNFQGLANEQGITFDGVQTAQYADLFSLSAPRNEAEMAIFQQYVDTTYDAFLERVADGRGLTTEEVRDIAEGRVWSGVDARREGLVDELGGLQDAIDKAAELAQLGDNYLLQEYPEYLTFGEVLRRSFSEEYEPEPPVGRLSAPGERAAESILPRGPLGREAARLLQALRQLDTFDDPMNAYARLPFMLQLR
ncbi:MAG: signal peptide peptidase SppA [Opitutales bacterium]